MRRTTTSTHGFESGQHRDAPGICAGDFELCELQTESYDCGVDVTLGDGRWFGGTKVREYAQATRCLVDLSTRMQGLFGS